LRQLKEKKEDGLGIQSKNRKREQVFDAVIVGHLSVDNNVWPKGKIENVLGGAPTYSGSTFSTLGKETGIFSAVGRDHFSKVLRFCHSKNIDTRGLLVFSERTMIFQNLYIQNGTRKQRCFNVAPKLSVVDLPENYVNSRAFYISPLAGEVDGELLKGLRRKGNIIMLDPQGLMRTVGKNGNVDVFYDKKILERIFKLVDIVKIGKDEIKAFEMEEKEILTMLEKIGVKIGIITRGKDTIMVSYSGRFFEVQTLNVEVEDPTGAGDVFGAAFLSEYMTRFDVEEGTKFAVIAAGLKIKCKGLTGFPSKEDITKHL
jgi:sugar/nucleoside kinase (ribokinase family)